MTCTTSRSTWERRVHAHLPLLSDPITLSSEMRVIVELCSLTRRREKAIGSRRHTRRMNEKNSIE